MMKPSLREIREIAVQVISERLDVSLSEAKDLLRDQMQKEVPHPGRALSIEETEEYHGIALSEILSAYDIIGRD